MILLGKKLLQIHASSDKIFAIIMIKNCSKDNMQDMSIQIKSKCFLNIISFIAIFQKCSKNLSLVLWANISIDSDITITRKLSVYLSRNKESRWQPKKAINPLLSAMRWKSRGTAMFSTNLTKTVSLNLKFYITSAKKLIGLFNM